MWCHSDLADHPQQPSLLGVVSQVTVKTHPTCSSMPVNTLCSQSTVSINEGVTRVHALGLVALHSQVHKGI